MTLVKLASKLLETYSLENLLEMNDLTAHDALVLLLDAGLIDPDAPAIVDIETSE